MEMIVMAKTTIARLFWGSLIAAGGALILLAAAGGLALANGSLVRDGPDVTGIRENAFGWVMAGLAAVAALVMIAAAVTQFIAWVGAVINTAGLKDKTWFIILLVTGLLSFGFIAMIIYLVAGPGDPPPVSAMAPAGQPASQDLRKRSA
jgi:uncharacterized membrane protein